MGRFFTSFDNAWQFFLEREEELEDFFADFPEEESFLLGWLVRLDADLVPRAHGVQQAFAHLDWITPQPEHFLHTWIGGTSFAQRRPTPDEIAVALERAQDAWSGVRSFEISYPRINCFHSAVVAEVEGDGLRTLASRLVERGYWHDLPIEGAMSGVKLDTFLPHLTIGTANRRHDPTPLRDVLVPLRNAELGQRQVAEATLCVIPASRTTILDPWEVVGAVALA